MLALGLVVRLGRDVELITCTRKRVVLEYKFLVLVLALVLRLQVLVIVLVGDVLVVLLFY